MFSNQLCGCGNARKKEKWRNPGLTSGTPDLKKQQNSGGRRRPVVEWGLAIKIALGGFGMVFATLVILCMTVRMTKSIVEKKEEEKRGK